MQFVQCQSEECNKGRPDGSLLPRLLRVYDYCFALLPSREKRDEKKGCTVAKKDCSGSELAVCVRALRASSSSFALFFFRFLLVTAPPSSKSIFATLPELRVSRCCFLPKQLFFLSFSSS
jgi:hypothetical protein